MQIKIEQANLGYGKRVILHDVSLTAETGRILCLLGKNGAGKTTLFKSLLGILPVIAGKVRLNGSDVSKLSRMDFARSVAYVPQARMLPFPFPVREVVLFGRTPHLSPFSVPGKDDKRIVDECLEMLHIAHLGNRTFTRLSGGEQQMVIIARALAQQPAFIIMDEPTSSLDFGNQTQVISIVNELKNQSLGIIMATHSPDQVFMCDADVAIVHDGKLRKLGYCNEVITEELLHEVYNVDVTISDVIRNTGQSRRICVPNIR
ncbi:MAG: ABC transporter ATP-binding protein [Proteiniphilum sp.]|jgi:iron complex transport system ATP-binding protein|nr:ABC transporter ATP-binding protein [Proteiniphilum sp.]